MMLNNLKPQAPDKILMLMQQYKEDPRPVKIDLGVGVYKDATGNTPVMRAIKAAEHQLWQQQTTKTYVGLAGDPEFGDAMVQLVLGDAVARNNVAAAATPGGTGAVRRWKEHQRVQVTGERDRRSTHIPGSIHSERRAFAWVLGVKAARSGQASRSENFIPHWQRFAFGA